MVSFLVMSIYVMLLLNIPELVMLLVYASKKIDVIFSVICISSITLIFNIICALIYLKELLCGNEPKTNIIPIDNKTDPLLV